MLRALRPNDTPSEQPVEPAADVSAPAVGLDGFKSETRSNQVDTSGPPGASRTVPWLVVILLGLVILEAVPAALWARDFFGRTAVVAVSPPPTVAAASTPPAVLDALVPCETPVAGNTSADATSKATASLGSSGVKPTTPAAGSQAIAAGVLTVVAPLALNVYNRGRLVGTSEADSIMLPLGSYELELVNDAVGYRTRKSVTLQAGRKTMLQIDPPAGTLHVNAVPWAEVFLDNQRLGETPIGNARVPVGAHDLVFRHPELGERRSRVLITLKEPARVSIDLRKP